MAGRGPDGVFSPGSGGGGAAHGGGGGAGGPGGGGNGANGSGSGGTSGSAAPQCNGELAAGPALMRRLSQSEFDNTIRDLLDDDSQPARDFVADGKVGLFENNAYSPMTSLLATQYAETAEALATTAMGKLEQLSGCDPSAASEEECARALITTLGKRAYRRPLRDEEITRLLAVYDAMRNGEAQHDHENASRVVISALLQSPYFLYHVEEGDPLAAGSASGATALTGYEVASRLSYLLWATMPDPALLTAADEGKLDDKAGVREQAERMLQDDKTREGVLRFYRQWLGINKVATLTKSTELFPAWTDELKADAQAETEALIDHVVWEGDGRLHTLLTAPFSFINERLAAVYGIANVSGDELRQVTVDPAERAGILSHISILSTTAHSEQTSPVHRGKLIRERFLCHELMAPPPEVDVTPPVANPALTTAERYAEHSSNAYCKSCHKLMDPIGLGFESYDAIGAFRSEENGKPIVPAGEVIEAADTAGPFNGLLELTARLSESREVHDCVASNWFSYSVGRSSGFPEDVCSVEQVRDDFSASGGNLKEVLLAIVESDGFRYRRPVQVEEETCP